jgi:hypothetical protein
LTLNFYSATLLFIILVDDGKPRKKNDYDESVVVFRSRSYQQAFQKALKIGHTMESEYQNKFNKRVRWAFIDVEKITFIGQSVNNQEVSSKLHSKITKFPIKYAHKFKPENSKPQEV